MCLGTSCSKAVTKESKSDSKTAVVPVIFSRNEKIQSAFIKLSAEIKNMIECCNLGTLQEACIETASSPESFIVTDLVPKIKATKTFRALCSMLADTAYWNFLDTRMMEAMVTASMIPAAQETMENFKRTFFNMKLSEVVPHAPVLPLKFGYTEIEEVINKNPKEFTIGELHEHCFFLETELFKTGCGTLRNYKIMIGSVIIVWQIHVDDVYKAYISMKNYQPPLNAIHLTIPQVQKWIDLPILWRGQIMEKVGPTKSMSSSIRHKPYKLPKQLEWAILNSGHYDEITEFTKDCTYYKVKKSLLAWIVLHPYFKTEYFFGIRKAIDKMLFGFASLHLLYITINGRLHSFLQSRIMSNELSLENLMHKEAVRIANHNKISHIMFILPFPDILKSVVTVTVWGYSFSNSPITRSLKTVGLRKMTAKDISRALALTNQYTSQFEITQVFQTKEEFSHYFLNMISEFQFSYVVEDPNTSDITDMFSFSLLGNIEDNLAAVNAIVVTKTPAGQLITDMLACVQKDLEGVKLIGTPQYGLSKIYFDKIFFKLYNLHFHFLNYNHPQIDEENFCFFPHYI